MSAKIESAKAVILENDRGHYTIPTKGLYPFQWNWDSALTALGIGAYDEARAWQEIETLFDHQWDDGMVPHIIFHEYDDGYFPGPEIWRTGRDVPTSGITQPPVAGFVVRRLYERAQNRELAERAARSLLPKIAKWHNWFYKTRDPKGEGLVAILHPWESGRDNSIDWDKPFERVPTEGVEPYARRDITHADPDHRPTKEQYDRYIWLLQKFRSLDWDNSKLHDASPFQVVDPGFNAILIRSCRDLAGLASMLGDKFYAQDQARLAAMGTHALEKLWSDDYGQYLCYDRVAGSLIENPSVAGILAVFAAPKRAEALALRIATLQQECPFIIPSQDPSSPEFDAKRYWRGPVWLIVNYMIADGLRLGGQTEMADNIVTNSLDLIDKSGFAEYYDPFTGEPLGGGNFTWTAAMVIEFLTHAPKSYFSTID